MKLRDLKARGHELIDSLIVMGVRKDSIYLQLKKRMRKYNQTAFHFQDTNTNTEALNLITELKAIIKKRNKQQVKRVIKKLINVTQSLEEYKKIQELKPVISIWTRLYNWWHE